MKKKAGIILILISLFCKSFSNFHKDSIIKQVEGIASYYSLKLHHSKTSTGERYHKNKMTAASNLFPLNSIVKVISLESNDSVIVRINDRMSNKMLKKNRVIDLSYIAAKKMHFLKQGLINVKVILLPNE